MDTNRAIIGAILGDIAGSEFEMGRSLFPDKEVLFSKWCNFTDDTVMSLAVKMALDEKLDFAKAMRILGRRYPHCGYARKFYEWLQDDSMEAYGSSWGNGAAMRVAGICDYFEDLEDVKKAAKDSAEVSHNHEEGIKGAVTTAVCIWMAKHGESKDAIYDYVLKEYPPEKYQYSGKSIDYLRKHYKWSASCMDCVPVAMRAFYECEGFESFMRILISLDGDNDTLGAIGGPVVYSYYGGAGFAPEPILKRFLTDDLIEILNK